MCNRHCSNKLSSQKLLNVSLNGSLIKIHNSFLYLAVDLHVLTIISTAQAHSTASLPLSDVHKYLLFRFSNKPMNLYDLLTFYWFHFKPSQQDGSKHTHFKVREEIARTLPTARNSKRTELQASLAISRKPIRVPSKRARFIMFVKSESL